MLSWSYKSFSLVSIILILSLSGVYAQAPWTRVTPTPVEQSLNDMVRIPGTERMIAVADGSTIMTSDDTGETWDISLYPADLDQEYDLSSVYFIDDMTGFIGTGFNSILKTSDGGLSWTVKYAEESSDWWRNLSGFCFMNDTIGFAISDYGLFLKSIDGGETWSQLDTTLVYGSKFQKIDNNKAYITSHTPNRWLKTIDGGETWVLEIIQGNVPGDVMSDIYFLDDSSAVASFINSWDFCSIYKTSDYGLTWDSICTPDWGLLSTDFDFSDQLHGIALCVSIAYYSTIIVTEDGGDTWTEIDEPLNWQHMNLTCYYNPESILAAGSMGHIFRSMDSGYTWDELNHRELGGQIFDVQFVNQNIGFLTCNSIGGGGISTHLYKTNDGGITWNYFQNPGPYPSSFYFLSEFVGYVAYGSEVFIYNDGKWETINTGFDFQANEIEFYNELTGVIAGEGRVIKTLDGGFSWSDITPLPNPGVVYNNVEFASSDSIYITSEDNVFRSYDGGWSWQSTSQPPSYYITDFFMINADTAFILAGGDILKSIDGTVTWASGEINTNGYFYAEAFYFPVSTTGFAVGSGEYDNIVKTTDGGNTWNSLTPISSTPLSCVYFSDENNGLVFGDLGLVMKTETGGVVSAGNITIAENSSNLLVNPNPFNRELRIGFNRQPVFPVSLSISDIAGKTITRKQIKNTSENVIPTDGLKSGVYILSVVYQDGLVEIRKVIKL